MAKTKHKRKPSGGSADRTVTFYGPVLQCIRQHARKSPQVEICGALIGRQGEGGTTVTGSVPGEGAAQGGAHVTFTQEAWVRIHEEKDRKYSGQAIVGWYHSHPGFGVFLSDHDLFIHRNFFSTPGSLAWVYDPHSDEEGCYGWIGGEVRRVDRYGVVSEVRQDISPMNEPIQVMRKGMPRPKWSLGLAFRPFSKISRTLALAVVAILLALLVGAGIYALLRFSPRQRPAQGTEPPRAVDVTDANEPAGTALPAKDVPSARRKPADGSGRAVRSGQEQEQEQKENGGGDGR